MLGTRRRLMTTFFGAAGFLAARPLFAAWQSPGVRPAPQPRPSPNAPDPNFPPGLNGPDLNPADAKAIKKQNQAEIKEDVAKLSELIGELKSQVERIDSDSTLSLSMVKKAQQIEKLAKRVKDLAKG